MRKRPFHFDTQLSIGEAGVQLAKMVFRSVYPKITDLKNDRIAQKRGMDLYVYDLGYVEVKTDLHRPRNFFLELSSGGKPGAIDRCCADYFCIIFPYSRVMFLLERPYLQKWLRDNYRRLCRRHKNWVKRIKSYRGPNQWDAVGLVVPRRLLEKDLDIIQIHWDEDDEIIEGVWT